MLNTGTMHSSNVVHKEHFLICMLYEVFTPAILLTLLSATVILVYKERTLAVCAPCTGPKLLSLYHGSLSMIVFTVFLNRE